MRAPLTREEVESGAWVVAFSGGALFLSDDLRALDDERAGWLSEEVARLSLSGAPSFPEDYFPAAPPAALGHAIADHMRRGASSHVVPSVWRTPDGARFGLNVGDALRTIEGVEVPARAVRRLP